MVARICGGWPARPRLASWAAGAAVIVRTTCIAPPLEQRLGRSHTRSTAVLMGGLLEVSGVVTASFQRHSEIIASMPKKEKKEALDKNTRDKDRM